MGPSQFDQSPASYKYFLRQNAQKLLDEMNQVTQQQQPTTGTGDVKPILAQAAAQLPQPDASSPQTSDPSAQIQAMMLSQGGPITENYGDKQAIEHYSGGFTNGTGIGVPEGTGVALPPGQWKVLQAFNQATSGGQGDPQMGINSGYGNSVLAQNAQTGEKLRFSHLSKINPTITEGATLPGQTSLGAVGHTGNTTGPHLNLEYYTPQGQLGDVRNSSYFQYLPTTDASKKAKGGGNPIMNALQNAYKGWTESPMAYSQNPNAGFMETAANSTANSPVGEVGQLAGMAGHALAPLMSHIGQGAPMLGMLGTKMASAAQQFSPLAYKIHPDDQQALIDMINAPKLNPQQQTDLQNLSQHYLGGQYPYKTTKSLLNTFDGVLGVQNRQPDPKPWTGR